MSRGPGKIERAIRALFDAQPDMAFITEELVRHCYPELNRKTIGRKHQVSVIRAAQKVTNRQWDVGTGYDACWESWITRSRNGGGNGWVFYNSLSLQSYALGQLIIWYPLTDPKALLRELEPGGDFYEYIAPPDGKWWREVQRIRAKLEREKAEKINPPSPEEQARRKAELDALAAKVNGLFAQPDKCFRGGGETLIDQLAPKLAELAESVRALASINEPDAQRASIAEIAASLDDLHAKAESHSRAQHEEDEEIAARIKAERAAEKARARKGVEAMWAAKKATAAKGKGSRAMS